MLLLAFLAACSTKKYYVDDTKLINIDGKMYESGAAIPFSGSAYATAFNNRMGKEKEPPNPTHFDNGQVTFENIYKEGRKVRFIAYREDGSIRLDTVWNHELNEKTTTWYFEDEKPSFQQTRRNGELHGDYITWFESGAIKSSKPHQNGNYHGLQEYWDEDGFKRLEWLYENGKSIYQKSFERN